jgi:hypothetical protein
MDSTIYNPLEDYENRLKSLHLKTTNEFFDKLVVQSGVDFAENRKTVKQYTDCAENKQKIKRKFNLLRFLRVLMCISLVLIPLVVCKTTPQIKTLRNEIANHEKKAQSLRDEALRQMAPLNALFSDKDAVNIIKSIIPSLSFDDCFSVKQENDMRINYDFREDKNQEESTLNLLSGNFNGNPFLYETKLIHRMGEETYHGYKTIYWTETYTDSNGKRCSRTESETLHATVTKPKPFYHTRTVLNYCAQGAPDLSFSRDASQLHTKNEKQIERLVKRGERKLNKKNDKRPAR